MSSSPWAFVALCIGFAMVGAALSPLVRSTRTAERLIIGGSAIAWLVTLGMLLS